jgi:hypothetical protein
MPSGKSWRTGWVYSLCRGKTISSTAAVPQGAHPAQSSGLPDWLRPTQACSSTNPAALFQHFEPDVTGAADGDAVVTCGGLNTIDAASM